MRDNIFVPHFFSHEYESCGHDLSPCLFVVLWMWVTWAFVLLVLIWMLLLSRSSDWTNTIMGLFRYCCLMECLLFMSGAAYSVSTLVILGKNWWAFVFILVPYPHHPLVSLSVCLRFFCPEDIFLNFWAICNQTLYVGTLLWASVLYKRIRVLATFKVKVIARVEIHEMSVWFFCSQTLPNGTKLYVMVHHLIWSSMQKVWFVLFKVKVTVRVQAL